MGTLRVLLVEDNVADAELAMRELKRAGLDFEWRRVETEADLIRECVEFAPGIVLADFSMPQFDGLSALRVVREHRPELPFIFVSGTIGEETAIESLRCGANDYILKNSLSRLPTAVRRAVQDAADRAARLAAEKALHLRDRAVEASVNPMLIVSATDPDMPLIHVNHAFEQITGYTRQEVVGRNCRFLQGSDRFQPELEHIRRAIATRTEGQALLRNYRKDGTLFWNKLHITPVRDPATNEVSHFVGVQYDLTDVKRYQEELEHQANHDALTGLANRNLLKDRLEQGIALANRYRRPFSVAFIDLDNFKLINDSLGHDIGDRVLKVIAERLAASVREGDTVARLGGDEFVLLLSDCARESGSEKLAQVVALTSKPFAIGRREFKVTCSVGIASFPADATDADTLLRNADTAMYRAKDAGRNNCQVYRADMSANLSERLTLETDLWNAVERDELVLHYQPKVEIETGRIVGMEALLRWLHPTKGVILPEVFIPIAEESGLIVKIGNWLIHEACFQNQAWQMAGLLRVPVAINVSARQIHNKDLAPTVFAALASAGLPPEHFEIELTESAVISNCEAAIDTLTSLRDRNIRVALDDFGTGYSSLSYLKRLPVTGLKIDQSFVRDVASDPDNAAIVRAIIVVAQELMLDVTAEGVETAEHVEFLKAHSCQQAQGFYFAPPVPASEMGALLRLGSLPALQAAGETGWRAS